MATVGSGLIVVISLILVIIEIRTNTEAVRAAAYQDFVAKSNEHLLLVASDSELVDLVSNGYNEPRDSLSATEQVRFFYYTRALWRNFDTASIRGSMGF
ncbi:MAG: hypothetical protein BMS9Abin05_1597 [Rhodothermia bacterium]|nr:MAG: hypothetical protein BMS9Abin05_1597 [Rhodothermia bacterium]